MNWRAVSFVSLTCLHFNVLYVAMLLVSQCYYAFNTVAEYGLQSHGINFPILCLSLENLFSPRIIRICGKTTFSLFLS